MNQFNMGNAWSKGVGFFSGEPGMHALILIVLGMLVPAALQLLLGDVVMGVANPVALGQSGLGGLAPLGGITAIVVMAAVYVLGIGSYFGSWRLGLGAGEDVGGAAVYGVVVGVLVVILFVVLAVVLAVLMERISPTLGAILFLVLMMALIAAVYAVIAALVAVGAFVLLLLALAFGATSNALGDGLGLGAEGAAGVAIVIFLAALLLWVAARLCCVGPAMANRRTFNLASGIAESWRVTAAEQWRIMGYLALIGLVLFVILVVLGLFGAGAVAGGGTLEQLGAGAMILGLLLGIPAAFLIVLVPAGIYRELVPEAPAEVFA